MPNLAVKKQHLSENVFSTFNVSCNKSETDFDQFKELDSLTSLENLGGYIWYKLKTMTPSVTNNYLSEGGLRKLFKKLVDKLLKLEDIFRDVNRDNLQIKQN